MIAFAVVSERDVGTLEQIMTSPASAVFVGGMGIAGLVGILWFQVPFVGNPFVFILGATLNLLSLLAPGLLIPTVCFTQQQAFATNFSVLNPFFILSGFRFPISRMPNLLRRLTYANPLWFFL